MSHTSARVGTARSCIDHSICVTTKKSRFFALQQPAIRFCADGSSQVLNRAFAQWHGLSVAWLNKVFGEPQFVDKSTSKMAGIMKEMGFIKEMPKDTGFA